MEESIVDLDLDEDEVPAGPEQDQVVARPSQEETATFKSVRSELRRTAKERDALKAERDELAAKVRERDERDAKATLAAAGFNDDQVGVFRKAYGEATPENIAAFEAVLGRRETTIPSFEPTVTSGETTVDRISRTQFENLMREPGKQPIAQQYAERGLVDWNRKE